MKLNRISGFASLGAFALVLLGSSIARAQGDQPSSADKTFVKTAIKGGNAEIELGQLAEQKGNSADVKKFGRKMVKDHTKLGEQMKGVAGQIGVTPPTVISPMDKALEMKLKALSGDDFDQAYIKAMVKGHQQDLADFQKEATKGNSPAVKEAASQGEQVISSHLQMIQKISRAHNVTVASSK
jgi:putative membrane protein